MKQIFGIHLGDLGSRSLSGTEFTLSPQLSENCPSNRYKLGRYIPLVMFSTWINLWGILPETFFECIFFVKLQIGFSLGKHSICYILEMVGPINVRHKEMSQLDAVLTRVPLTLTFDLEFSRWNGISGMGSSIVMEWREGSQGCPDVKR